jgi:hypothetical protein
MEPASSREVAYAVHAARCEAVFGKVQPNHHPGWAGLAGKHGVPFVKAMLKNLLQLLVAGHPFHGV